MKKIEQIKQRIRKHKKILETKYNIERIGIFGSYVKNQADEKSDLDILIEFKESVDFFTYLEIEEYLTEILGIKVDLVMKKTLKSNIGKYILKETIYV